jgi:hypothetical protein
MWSTLIRMSSAGPHWSVLHRSLGDRSGHEGKRKKRRLACLAQKRPRPLDHAEGGFEST